ncbi:uncharacterized protein LOC131164404 isoform X2 [Malania oleifera]|uniref:uncharacterized protein LOC131164404 isoform X2 n=1 Tax=Malania oleifera TaxID=397392 RepID=UPI0025AE0CB3|nr:uncharacterized protein LOC131164404 isoform X2 [Malania oleifera]
MAKNPIMGSAMNLSAFVFFACVLALCSSYGEQSTDNSFTYSSFGISPTKLKHYDWRYIRVDLPPWFSSISVEVESDVDLDQGSIDTYPKSKLPVICFRDGAPPLPDVSNVASQGLVPNHFFNRSGSSLQYLQNVEQCYPLFGKITLTLRHGQITPGVLYVGLFNGIGPIRTQSKMINRGSAFSFGGNVTVVACTNLTMSGQYCNQTANLLSCARSDLYKLQKNYIDGEMHDQMVGSVVACRNHFGASCHENMELKFYSLDVIEVVDQITTAAAIKFDQARSINNTQGSTGIVLMCYVRYGAFPEKNVYDYSIDLSKAPLVIQSPKVGTWYFAIQLVNQLNVFGGTVDNKTKVCYSMIWRLLGCPHGKAGPSCLWERYLVQEFGREYPTVHADVPVELPKFPLEPLLSKSSYNNSTDLAWTYFLLDVPDGEAGKNINIQLTSNMKISYEIFARFGGLPSLNMWDYAYSNQTGYSNSDSMFKLYDSSEGKINFYIFYAREGPWSIGIRHPIYMGSPSSIRTIMSVSIESCPYQCSDHGKCQYHKDASGLSGYSYCSCDRTHGGFDCSAEMVSREEQRWSSISLIASNAAAIFPAYLAFRQKAFADWIIFLSSGISSGLYHACDVGSGCALSFRMLQFLDFWLSFMAVVSTFVHLTAIGEGAKRAIHTVALIVTGFMAASDATRSRNIVLIVAIGALGLLVGWFIEFCSMHNSHSFSHGSWFRIFGKWQNIQVWLLNIMRTLYQRFHWGYVFMGSVALSMAAISWTLESTQSYWIWHSQT